MLPPGSVRSGGALAARLGLPSRFVEQQLTALAASGTVRSVRGPGGGFALGGPAEQISMRDVVVALQGDVLDVPRVTGSAVAEAWQHADEALEDALARVSLADLAQRQRELDAETATMYYI
jgi:Rrf2 family iron-sulfur cluster assembly transcriptional regulator